jgi:hypothetical protein
MMLDSEICELLRTVVRYPESTDHQELIRLTESVDDWTTAIAAARKHGVLAMLYTRLVSAKVPVPPASLNLLRAEYDRNVFHSLANAAELLTVLNAFGVEGICAMPFKGVVLGASIYGDMLMRPAGDLDFLIHHRDLERATTILLKRGFQLTTEVRGDGSPVAQYTYEYHFERATDGMVVELRWRLELSQPRFRQDLGMDWVWESRRFTTLAGASVPDLAPVTLLLALCMHGSKHLWSRLIWTSDVARFLEKHPNLEWKYVMREARRTGLSRALALGVVLAHRVAAAPVPQSVLKELSADRPAFALARHFDQNLLTEPGRAPESWIPYNIQLLGFGDRIKFLFSSSFLKPNVRDRSVIRLPKALDPFYSLIRPVRILLDRSER